MHISGIRLVVLAAVVGSAVATVILAFAAWNVLRAQADFPHAGLDFSISAGAGGEQCDSSNTSGLPTTCAFASGSTFTVSFRVNAIPPMYEYSGYDSYLMYTPGVSPDYGSLTQTGTGAWPECGFPFPFVGTGVVAPACLVGSPPAAQTSTYTGIVWHIDFTCSNTSSTNTLTLFSGNGITDLVTMSGQGDGEAAYESLTVDCTGGPPPPTATPVVTSTPIIPYTAHLSIGPCTANCNVPVPGSNFIVDINLDTWPAAYENVSIDLTSTTGNCISAGTAAMAASWSSRDEASGCLSLTTGEAAAAKGPHDSPATQKGKIGEITFKCSHDGTISLGSGSYIGNASTGATVPVAIGDLRVVCASNGPTATPTATPTSTPTAMFATSYTGHISIGSCTANCSLPLGVVFAATLSIDTIAAPYDSFAFDINSTVGSCKSANTNASSSFWNAPVNFSSCIRAGTGEAAAVKSASDASSRTLGNVGEINFTCSHDGTLSVSTHSGDFTIAYNHNTGSGEPITVPPLQVFCNAGVTPTPTSTPPPPVGGISIDPALPSGAAAHVDIEMALSIAAAAMVAMGAAGYARRRGAPRG